MKQQSKHERFILNPINSYIEECLDDLDMFPRGISLYPLGQYILQSLFLRMTGAQEQKMKCICWELASENLEFRRIYLKENSGKGFSAYDDKQYLYANMVKFLGNYNLLRIIKHQEIIDSTNVLLQNTIASTVMPTWCQRSFNEAVAVVGKLSLESFGGNCLLNQKVNGVDLQSIYIDQLYVARNRYAHNTRSYQSNLPSLRNINEQNFSDNFILWYCVLFIIDSVFINLYKEFRLQTLSLL